MKSSHSLMVVCEMASPVPRTQIGRVGAVAGPLLVGEHDGAAAVGADAAVELCEGVHDHRGIDDVVDRDGVLVVGVRVEAGVVAGGDGDLGQLLDGGAELVHVAPGRPWRSWRPRGWPNGASNWIGPRVPKDRLAVRSFFLRSARWVDP